MVTDGKQDVVGDIGSVDQGNLAVRIELQRREPLGRRAGSRRQSRVIVHAQGIGIIGAAAEESGAVGRGRTGRDAGVPYQHA